jgi:hypothetical protein
VTAAMAGTQKLEQALRGSVFGLIAERRRIEDELIALEKQMAMARGNEARSLDEQMALHREALVALTAQQAEQEEERRQTARKAAAKAARERLTGHAATLANEHAALLDALAEAETHAAAMVGAINRALDHEAGTRGGASALAAELGVRTDSLGLSREEAARRLSGNLCAALRGISACRMGRLGGLTLPAPDPDLRACESWSGREGRHTSGGVELLLEACSSSKADAA